MINFFKRKYIATIIFSAILIAFTVYILLDTFAIERVYKTILTSATNRNVQEFTVTENSYKDSDIKIQITTYREYDTDIYVADIKLSSPEYLKTAFAKNAYGRNITDKTSNIARNTNAILAINGDYYGAREKGYVVRNGVLYRQTPSESTEDLIIYNNGDFGIIKEKETAIENINNNDNIREIFSFGPALIIDYNISVTENDEVDMHMVSNPRTAIGIIDINHYIFIVSDGRTKENKGLSLLELAEFMQKLSVKTAYNLDGGGSSTMVFNNRIINKPVTYENIINERSVSDIVYIG